MIDTFTIRCNILHLAFSGKLTIQIEEEGTAQDILNFISEKKSIVSVEEGPYTIPDSWAWVRLKDLYKINPKVIADNDTAAAFIPMERISGGFDKAFTFEIQKWEKASKNHTKFEDGDVAFAKITPCFENRKSFIAHDLPNGIGGGTTELIILRQKEMLPQYTYYLVLDQRFITTGTASYKGVVGQQRVQSDVIKNYLVPVAPYSEQKRIVEKIEQVFSILDTIDELQAKYADNLTALKSKLIDAAIQGKLTEQLPEDGTAEEFYQQIQEEKQKLIKEGKIKKQKPLPEITDEEIPFDIPDNWKWTRFADVLDVRDGTHDTPKYVTDGIPLVTSKNLRNGLIDFESAKLISYEDAKQINNRSRVDDGDILLAMIGTIGNPVLVKKDREFSIKNMALFKPIDSNLLDMSFVLYYLKNEERVMQEKARGGLQPFVSLKILRTSIIPLPPLAEQKRIVQKLEEILPICEKI